MTRPAGAETPEEVARKLVEKEILPPKPGLSAREEISASAHRLYAEDLIAAALRAAEDRGAREMRERCAAAVHEAGYPDRYPKPPDEFDRGWRGCADVAETRIRALPLTPPAQDGGSDTQP